MKIKELREVNMKTEHTMEKITKQMKADSYQMAALSVEVRNTILANV